MSNVKKNTASFVENPKGRCLTGTGRSRSEDNIKIDPNGT
jgi:hypothetical protein